MEWVEVQAKTVDEAIDLAVAELGVSSRDQVTIEILQEPKGGFLGLGRQEALVKVTPKPKQERKRRRRRRKRSGQQGSNDGAERDRTQGKAPSAKGSGSGKSDRGGRPPKKDRQPQSDRRQPAKERKPMKSESNDKPSASIEEQAEVAKDFVSGLIEALGLEGNVATRIDGDILYLDVTGDQTEALVGPKGATMQALHELTRTVIQRKTFGAPRMRLDVAGYTERRREALGIYAGKLATRVLDSGEELMLEPMNPADRKVVHDAVVDIEGVISFSEGEDPNRAVVLAPDPDNPAPPKAKAESDQQDGDEAETSTEDADSADEPEPSDEAGAEDSGDQGDDQADPDDADNDVDDDGDDADSGDRD